MIVVKVEMWPAGDANKAEPLGILAIVNRGKPGKVPYLEPGGQRWRDYDLDEYSYDVEFQKFKGPHAGKTRTSLVHYRRRGWVQLVHQAVLELFRG